MQPGFLDILLIVYICTNCTKALIVYGKFTPVMEPALRRRIVFTAIGVATFTCLLFVFVGTLLLRGFYISQPALMLAGGVILLAVALQLVHDDGTAQKADAAPAPAPGIGIAYFPLALPLMASPHGLVAIVSLTGSGDRVQMLMTAAAVLLVMTNNLIVLLLAEKVLALLGPTTLKVAATIAGLLLSALAVQMMVTGLTELGLLPAAAQTH